LSKGVKPANMGRDQLSSSKSGKMMKQVEGCRRILCCATEQLEVFGIVQGSCNERRTLKEQNASGNILTEIQPS
jgi:hypothetical protein